jgi:hypothetical protein
MTLTDAFRRYKATLVNNQWAVSAISENNELVISCWEHYIKTEDGVLRYRDSFHRWEDNNTAGRNLLKEHVTKAFDEGLTVRLVIVRTEDTDVVDSGADASRIKKHFFIREEFRGTIMSFDGDNYVIDYKMVK